MEETLFEKKFTYVTKDPKRREALIKKHLIDGFELIEDNTRMVKCEFEDKFVITLSFYKPIII